MATILAGTISKSFKSTLENTVNFFIHNVFPPNNRICCFFLEKSWELLGINHSLSERRDIFVSQLLKLSHVLVVLQLAWVPTSLKLSCIMQSGLALFLGCLGFCGIAPNEPVDSVVSFSIPQDLKC